MSDELIDLLETARELDRRGYFEIADGLRDQAEEIAAALKTASTAS